MWLFQRARREGRGHPPRPAADSGKPRVGKGFSPWQEPPPQRLRELQEGRGRQGAWVGTVVAQPDHGPGTSGLGVGGRCRWTRAFWGSKYPEEPSHEKRSPLEDQQCDIACHPPHYLLFKNGSTGKTGGPAGTRVTAGGYVGASCQQEDSTVLAVSSTNQSALMRGDAPDCSGEGVHTAEVTQAQVFPLLLPSSVQSQDVRLPKGPLRPHRCF